MSSARLSSRASRAQHREVFSRIFQENAWGCSESVSGPGSTRAQGGVVTPGLISLVERLGVTSLLDAPCGDFNWAGELAAAVQAYFGVDVVEELISRNQREHGGPHRTFLTCDLTRDALPRADLILSRDCLVHFSYADVWAALENFRRSGAEYLLTTTFVDHPTNRDIETGGWRTLNFQAAPFEFPAPMAVIDERLHAAGEYRDKRLALWRMDDVPAGGRDSRTS
jgi:SAM-dependent methyltransferase